MRTTTESIATSNVHMEIRDERTSIECLFMGTDGAGWSLIPNWSLTSANVNKITKLFQYRLLFLHSGQKVDAERSSFFQKKHQTFPANLQPIERPLSKASIVPQPGWEALAMNEVGGLDAAIVMVDN